MVSLKYLKKIILNQLPIYWPFLTIFIYVFTICFISFDSSKGASTYFDTTSYMQVSELICKFSMPNIGFRPPGYPLLIVLTGGCERFRILLIVQMLMTAFSAVILLWIINQLIKNKIVSFFITIIVFSDILEVIGYSQIVLTETFTLFLLMVFLFLHIKLFQKFTTKIFFLCILIDFLFIITKPILFLLPIVVYSTILIFIFSKNKNKKIALLKPSLWLIAINILLIFGWSSLNYKQNGYYGISTVSEINRLGVMVHHGYLKDINSYDNPPTILSDLSISSKKPLNYKDPWKILADLNGFTLNPSNLDLIFKSEKYSLNKINEVNSFLFNQNKNDYIIKSWERIDPVLKKERLNYGFHYNLTIVENNYFKFINNLFDLLIEYRILLIYILIGISMLMYVFNRSASFIMAILTLTVLYFVFSVSIFSYSEESRLRMPITPILNGLTLLVIYSSFDFIVKNLKKWTK